MEIKSHDILTDENGNLITTADGDLVVGESDGQHVMDIFISDPGVWRFSPLSGIGIKAYENAPDTIQNATELEKKIKLQLEFDGYKIDQVLVPTLRKPFVKLKRIR